MEEIYLDYNATAPLRPEIANFILDIMAKPYNASSIHYYGVRAKSIISTAKDFILASLEVDNKDYELIFTGSGTESNNLVIYSNQEKKLLISAKEHPSISVPGNDNLNLTIIPIDSNGLIKLDYLDQLLVKDFPTLVSVMLANNETGVIEDINTIAKIVHAKGGLLHVDAIQAWGKLPISLNQLAADLLTISAHKIGGPLGAAALIYKKKVKLNSLIKGGMQQKGIRAGTENTSAIAGFGKIAQNINQYLLESLSIKYLRDYLEIELLNSHSEIEIVSNKVTRLNNTSCIIMPGVKNYTQLINFDLAKIALSAGSACSSGKVSSSSILLAMGYNDNIASCAIRISLGYQNNKDQIDYFLKVWKEMYNRISLNYQNNISKIN